MHDVHGVGRVTSQDDSGGLMIDFGAGEDLHISAGLIGKLKALRPDGLEALLWDSPGETGRWVTEAPLRLLAAVLTDVGGTARTVVIRDRLEGRVLGEGVSWNRWWMDVRAAAAESDHFRPSKNKKGSITALSLPRGVRTDDVPMSPLQKKPRAVRQPKKKPATMRDWKRWLLAEGEEPAPGNWPNANLLRNLDRWTSDEVELAFARTIGGARAFLESGNKSSKGQAGWLNAVSRLSRRSQDFMRPDSDYGLVEQAGELLCEAVWLDAWDGIEWPHAAAYRGDNWQEAFATGVWAALSARPGEIRDAFRALRSRLDRRTAASLAEEICLSAFRAGDPDSRDLDALLGAMTAHERQSILYTLIVRSAFEDGRGSGIVSYIADTRHADSTHLRPKLLLLSALLFRDVPPAVLTEASVGLADVLKSTGESETPLRALVQEIRTRDEKGWAETLGELEYKLGITAEQLESSGLEAERLGQQAAALRAQMKSGREESRLEVRRGMLLAIGDVLQRAHGSANGAEARLQDVIDTIPTVLREGGAEELGAVGDVVPFDPQVHHSVRNLPRGTEVRLLAPGVIVRGDELGDSVILKASVTVHGGDG